MRVSCAVAVIGLAVAGWTGPASADPWKDESGHGRWRERSEDWRREARRRESRAFSEEFRRGGCKIERKWEKDGEYKEEIKCRGGRPPAYVRRFSDERRGYAYPEERPDNFGPPRRLYREEVIPFGAY